MDTLDAVLLDRARRKGEQPFILYYDDILTYADLEERAGSLAKSMARMGVGAGDVVAIMLPNCPELVVVMFAAWKLGAAVTPINIRFKHIEIRYQLQDSDAKLAVIDDAYAPEFDLASAGFTNLGAVVTVKRGHLEARDPGMLGQPKASGRSDRGRAADGTALIIYTSGTTGHPKGVMLSHENLIVDASQIAQALGVTAQDRGLLVLPQFHVNGIVITTVMPILCGGSVVLRERFVLEEFVPTVARFRPTFFSAVPTIYTTLLEVAPEHSLDVASLRLGICGAAPMPVEVIRRFELAYGFPIIEGYGLSEGTCVSTFNPVDGARKVGSVGLPLSGQELRIVDDNDRELPIGEVGEIVIRGSNVMQGYLRQPEATKETMRSGWLHTGDLGRRDEDGYFYVVDRKKDMIIRGGENIYPKEVENVLYTYSKVTEAAVVGVPDPKYGEQVAAYIALKTGETATSEEIVAFCANSLARFKLPKYVEFLPAIPKNSVGKIDKKELRKLWAASSQGRGEA